MGNWLVGLYKIAAPQSHSCCHLAAAINDVNFQVDQLCCSQFMMTASHQYLAYQTVIGANSILGLAVSIILCSQDNTDSD